MENVQVLTSHLADSGNFFPLSSAELSRLHEVNQQTTLMESLQTTLDTQELLDIFAAEVSKFLQFNGLQFHSQEGLFESSNSACRGHARFFELALGGQRVGRLVYYSKAMLSAMNVTRLQVLHEKLLYPLRNSLLFRQVKLMAARDPLTQLANRSAFDEQLTRHIQNTRRNNRRFVLAVLDLDNFKPVNDQHGHLVGDDVLREFARLLGQCIRGTDTAYRFGGDEFALLLDTDNIVNAEQVALRVQYSVLNNSLLKQYNITSSMGFTLVHTRDDVTSIFTRADNAMYQAKQQGRNRIVFG